MLRSHLRGLGRLRLSTRCFGIIGIVAILFVLSQCYISSFFDITTLTSFGTKNNWNDSLKLRRALHALVTNEIARLIRSDLPVVEDVGEAILKSWSELDKSFCENELRLRNHRRKLCLHSCHSNSSAITSKRVLVIIPFRNRHQHLEQMLPHLERLLKKQNLCYLIVIAEQLGTKPFNKGILMNSAFVEALKWFPFHCAIFHDVDLIPLNDSVPYNCGLFPRHISVAVDKFNNMLPYVELIGGVLSIPLKAFLRVNGFSNMYWGWGAEDDDMYERLMSSRIPITRPDPDIAQFKMLNHSASPAFSFNLRSEILLLSRARFRLDGLNSLNYTVKNSTAYYDNNLNVTGSNLGVSSVPSNSWLRILHLEIDVGPTPKWLA